MLKSFIFFKTPFGDYTDLEDSESESTLLPKVFDKTGVA
jgi:hypothetical protein